MAFHLKIHILLLATSKRKLWLQIRCYCLISGINFDIFLLTMAATANVYFKMTKERILKAPNTKKNDKHLSHKYVGQIDIIIL